MILANGRWHKFGKETATWYESEYSSWATKPDKETLMASCAIPSEPFRKQALLSFKTVVVIAVLFMILRLAFTPDAVLFFVGVYWCIPLWAVRFFRTYHYVNKRARLEAERLACQNSTSSRK